jgi:2-polyprenyl-3-methyl-5-hydroxy-6-metoxy-1,4-benzoquinol methylase
MRRWAIPYLICPKTKEPLELSLVTEEKDGDVLSGELISKSGSRYRIVGGVPRFVQEHYAKGFGLQWNEHAATQIDDIKHRHSHERFWGETGFEPEALTGRIVLDGGCGAGRFTDIAARAGARVIAVDLSEAADACYANNRERQNVTVLQASLFELPVEARSVDFAFTIGVIQHTPEPLRALRALAETVKVGGEAGVSWYKKYWYTYLHQKYALRPFFKLMDEKRLYQFVQWYVPKLLPVSRALGRMLPDPEYADRIIPVANRDNIEGLTEQQKLEWAILDTYDWYQPRYDKPQSWRAVERVMTDLGFQCARAPLQRRGLHCVRITNS